MTSIFIIAASDVVRAGLESLLAGAPEFTLAGSAADWSTLGTEGEFPDLVVIDAERRSEETSEALRNWEELAEGHKLPALVVIGGEREEWLRAGLRAGVVRAALPHSAAGVEIVAAVDAVANGLIVLDPETFASLLSAPLANEVSHGSSDSEEEPRVTPSEATIDELTPREREVLNMLAEGLSNKEIAWRMTISEHTVKFHVASIFAKLDASTRTEAVMHGIRKGLIMM